MQMKQPDFPETFNGFSICWGMGNHLVGLQLLASIPAYAFYKEGDPERERLQLIYWESKQKEYDEAKKLYEDNVFVGTTFRGGTDVECRITKIHIDSEKAYVCYKASHEYQAKIDEENKKPPLFEGQPKKWVKPDKFGLSSFLSAIKNGSIKIIKVNKDG